MKKNANPPSPIEEIPNPNPHLVGMDAKIETNNNLESLRNLIVILETREIPQTFHPLHL
jgi:hypothetical protein